MTGFNISCPTDIRFGAGRAGALPNLLPDQKSTIVLVEGKSGTASAPVRQSLEASHHDLRIIRCIGEPSVASVNAALGCLTETPIDVVVACGGGSVLDMGKALAVLLDARTHLPRDFAGIAPATLNRRATIRLIAIPTTAGTGAEVTANAVLDNPEQGAKISIRGRALFPDIAIVDPALMQSAPPLIGLYAGLDALTQVIESHTSRAATPFSEALTGPAIPKGAKALRAICEQGGPDDWSDMAWVSLASGLALANSGLGAAHGIASILGSSHGAPHGALCGRLLIPTLRCNQTAAEGSTLDRITHVIGAIADVFPPDDGKDPLSGLDRWTTAQGLPRLGHWGVRPDALAGLAERARAASSSQKNAVPLTDEHFVTILQEAL